MKLFDTSAWTAVNSAILSKQITSPCEGIRLLKVAYGGKMGNTAYGKFFYGIIYGTDALWNIAEKWEVEVDMEVKKVDDEVIDWDDPADWIPACLCFLEGVGNTWENREKMIEKWGVEIDYFGDYDEKGYYITLKDKNFEADWEGLEEITQENLQLPDGVDEKIKKFCDLLGLSYRRPKWCLTSFWG
jgi:hypothetical protein